MSAVFKSSKIVSNMSAPAMEIRLTQVFDFSKIVERTPEVLSLGEDMALRVLKEYIRFLVLKVRASDFHAKKLSPAPLVDALWHSREYANLHLFTLITLNGLRF